MNNMLSHFGLVFAKMRASDKDLPVVMKCNKALLKSTYLDTNCEFGC